jgi:hypothetical protein
MRELLAFGYGFLTLIICVQAMRGASFRVGAEALEACVSNFAGMAILFTCFLLGQEKGYRRIYLFGAGAIGLVPTAAGFALMIRTGFRIYFYDSSIRDPCGWCWASSPRCCGRCTERPAYARAGDPWH